MGLSVMWTWHGIWDSDDQEKKYPQQKSQQKSITNDLPHIGINSVMSFIDFSFLLFSMWCLYAWCLRNKGFGTMGSHYTIARNTMILRIVQHLQWCKTNYTSKSQQTLLTSFQWMSHGLSWFFPTHFYLIYGSVPIVNLFNNFFLNLPKYQSSPGV